MNALLAGLGGLLGVLVRPLLSSGLLHFPFFSELVSLIPLSIGFKLRRAVYARLLPQIGEDAVLHFGVVLEDVRSRLGRDVWISAHCHLDFVEIGDHVLVGPRAVLLSGGHRHRMDRIDLPIKLQGNVEKEALRIGRGAWIGAGAIVMAEVGADAVVGAGAVVTRPVPPFAIVAGNPARVVRMRSASAPTAVGKPD